MDIRRRCCNSRDMFRSINLSLDLELALQPVAAVLGVPQGLRNGPQLSRNSSFLLCDLLQLGGDGGGRGRNSEGELPTRIKIWNFKLCCKTSFILRRLSSNSFSVYINKQISFELCNKSLLNFKSGFSHFKLSFAKLWLELILDLCWFKPAFRFSVCLHLTHSDMFKHSGSAGSYLSADLLQVLVSLLDLIHAALQVCVELNPLCLQPTHHLVHSTPTCQDKRFLSCGRKTKCETEQNECHWFCFLFGKQSYLF